MQGENCMQQWFGKFVRGKTFSTLFLMLVIGLIFYLSLRLGQMVEAFLATVFTKMAYGSTGFYGYTETNRTHSIVSSGTGYFRLSIRVGTNSEIVEIEVMF